VRALDALLLTHADADHVGGAAGLIPLIPPAQVWEGVPVAGLPVIDVVRRAAATAGAEWGAVAAGRRARLARVDVRVLHPPAPDWERRRPRNDDSVVLELQFGAVSLILPGDVGPAVEATLADALGPSALRVLKAAHHGSRASSTAAFLDAVHPAIVLASAGRANRHGHPDPAVVARAASVARRSTGPSRRRHRRRHGRALAAGHDVRGIERGSTPRRRRSRRPARRRPAARRGDAGRPLSTTSEARVSTEAPGRDTNARCYRSVQRSRPIVQRT
jgi:hypothetical protein